MKTDNELIAEFMGVDYKNGWNPNQQLTPNYDKSWDALMPVVEKCQNLEFSEKAGWQYIILTSNISSVYSQVVEFIKWYNQQNPKEK